MFILTDLHPIARPKFKSLISLLGEAYRRGDTKTLFEPFTGYRPPERQAELYNQHPRVTYVRAWRSAHQYGLAVDFIAHDDMPWDDAHDWEFLKITAVSVGLLRPISWDKGHIIHPAWNEVHQAWL